MVLHCSCRCNCSGTVISELTLFWTVTELSLYWTPSSIPLRESSADWLESTFLKGWVYPFTTTYAVEETSVSVSFGITLYLCLYNGNASVHCKGNHVSKLIPLIMLSGIPRQWYRMQLPSRWLTMDVCSDSDIQEFRQHATLLNDFQINTYMGRVQLFPKIFFTIAFLKLQYIFLEW
jgi:hypothetical protein